MKVEVDVLVSPSLIILTVSVDVMQSNTERTSVEVLKHPRRNSLWVLCVASSGARLTETTEVKLGVKIRWDVKMQNVYRVGNVSFAN